MWSDVLHRARHDSVRENPLYLRGEMVACFASISTMYQHLHVYGLLQQHCHISEADV